MAEFHFGFPPFLSNLQGGEASGLTDKIHPHFPKDISKYTQDVNIPSTTELFKEALSHIIKVNQNLLHIHFILCREFRFHHFIFFQGFTLSFHGVALVNVELSQRDLARRQNKMKLSEVSKRAEVYSSQLSEYDSLMAELRNE